MTREDVQRLVQENWNELIEMVILDLLTLKDSEVMMEEASERLLNGGKEYGEFDLKSINAWKEVKEELLDAINYRGMFLAQREEE